MTSSIGHMAGTPPVPAATATADMKAELNDPALPYDLLLSCPLGLTPLQVRPLSFCLTFRALPSVITLAASSSCSRPLPDLVKVSVDFDGSYDRIPHPDINLENSISEVSFESSM